MKGVRRCKQAFSRWSPVFLSLAVVCLVSLACGLAAPVPAPTETRVPIPSPTSSPVPTATDTPAPTETPLPSATSIPPTQIGLPTLTPTAGPAYQIVKLNPEDGSLADQLSEQTSIAASLGLKPFVNWYAKW